MGLRGWFNDFHVYYLAGRLVAEGRSPYDTPALAELGRALGLDFVVGGGYSYPPPFAVAMVPLAGLPFGLAVGLFTLVSIVVFAATVAWWLSRVLPGTGADAGRRRALLALGAGLYPPVAGSVFAGQANLLVFGLLGVGLAPFLPVLPGARDAGGSVRSLVAGGALGLAGIVKLFPLALAVPLAFDAPRRRAAGVALLGLAIGVGGSLLAVAALAPAAGRGASSLADLFGPDPFWTNQSLNGAISRLFLDSGRTAPLLRGDPVPWVVAATAALAVATGLLLLRALSRRADRVTLALALALTIVAATAGAPKNSFWNDSAVLLAVALAIAARALMCDRARTALVVCWLVATVLQFGVDRWLADASQAGMPIWTLLSSSGLLALLALWLALAIALNRGGRLSIDGDPVRRDTDGA